jgi:hypothetical protein
MSYIKSPGLSPCFWGVLGFMLIPAEMISINLNQKLLKSSLSFILCSYYPRFVIIYNAAATVNAIVGLTT